MSPSRMCCWIAAGTLLSACPGPAPKEAAPLKGASISDRVAYLESQVFHLKDELQRVERRAFCPPTIKKLLEDVRDHTSCKEGDVCVSPLIEYYVAQGTSHGRFLELMSAAPYAVFYPRGDSKGDWGYSFGKDSRGRLRTILSPPWLPNTKFLIVSNQGQKGLVEPAIKRIKFIMTEMGRADFPEGHIDVGDLKHPVMVCKDPPPGQETHDEQILRWAFSFKLMPGEQLNPIDRPPRGNSIDDAVMVFRVDCPLDPRKPNTPQSKGQS